MEERVEILKMGRKVMNGSLSLRRGGNKRQERMTGENFKE